MRDPHETDFTGNVPGNDPADKTGTRIFAAFGGVLGLALLIALAVIGLVWWLAFR
ncbi:MAG: hypothetical protein WAO58_00075 [Fimbriimonadaceae bacterium]